MAANKSPSKGKILLVDDDPGLLRLLSIRLRAEGYDVEAVESAHKALATLNRFSPDLVITDLRMDKMDGIGLLKELQTRSPGLRVVIMTAHGTIPDAVVATQSGAFGFLTKPVDKDELMVTVEKALKVSGSADVEEDWASNIITRNQGMKEILQQAKMVAATDARVLITGESGTGKEILARALHNLSDRRDHDFIAINCAAIPENLLESELFGYEKGAFTGANKQTKGKLEFADRGTLFLDEIGDLPASLQAKLLRFLQERVIERVGGREEIAVDTRVICATHKDLRALIEQEAFREDLYYRISEVAVTIPPLRERPGDTVLIARALLDHFKDLHKGRVKDFSSSAIRAISAYEWPGNVRELENRVKRAAIMADHKLVEPADLELEDSGGEEMMTLKEWREQAEAKAIVQALAISDGQVGRAAELLGVSRPTVYHLLKKYGIEA